MGRHSRSARLHAAELCLPRQPGRIRNLGASVVGISAQSPEEQQEFAEREHIPFPLLSDAGLHLRSTLQLPTFEVSGMTLYKRLTLIVDAGVIVKTFYPVFPPDTNASEVLAWLRREWA